MSSVSASGRSPGLRIAIIVLAVIAVLLVINGVMDFTEPAKSLLIGKITSPTSRANAHRPLWGTASLIVAAVCAGAAVMVARGKGSASSGSDTRARMSSRS